MPWEEGLTDTAAEAVSCFFVQNLALKQMVYSVFTENENEKNVLYYWNTLFLTQFRTKCAYNQNHSLPVSHSNVDSAGHFLFNDNTLIPLNSIIRVIKEP